MPEINITVREPNTEGVEELLDDLRAFGESAEVLSPGVPTRSEGKATPEA